MPERDEGGLMLTYADLEQMPLRDQAHFWLYGRLPDGRRAMVPWTKPHSSIHHYVRLLEAQANPGTGARLAVRKFGKALARLADA